MELVKLVINSHKRADRVVTKDAFANCAICIPLSQVDEYHEFNPESELVVHPDEVIGLSAKFKWVHKKFGNVVQLDDDIQHFKRVYLDRDAKEDPYCTAEEAYDVVQMTAQVAKDIGALMFGFGKEASPVGYSGHEPFGMTGFVIGGCMGFFKDFRMEIPDRVVAATDQYISLLNAYFHRKCWFDRRYYTMSKEGTFTSTGGMSDFRSVETEKSDFLLLKEMFGGVVVRKRQNPLRELQHPYERTIKIPF